MMLFQVNALTKTYGNRTVLDLPSLGLEKGLIYSLQGPNGSGKTTLLDILSFLALPTSGEILYEDRKVDPGRNSLTALRREVVMVPQNPILFTTTVYRNIELGLKIRGVSKAERERAVHECLDLVGMRDFLNAPAHKLSGGETQRIAIARALACSPKVIFFDEPTSNVDGTSQKAIERIMKDINARKNISLVFTTHDPGQASRLSHRVITLFDGRLVNSAFGNIFKGYISTEENGEKLCLLEDRVHLVVEAHRSGEVKVSLDPTKIKVLGQGDPGPLQNRMKGIVVRLTDEGSQILLTLDVGIPLNVFLSKDDPSHQSLTLRQEVQVHCPPEAIQVF